MDKKNTMLLTVIAIATLLVAVVGATFAYFSITADANGVTTTNVNGQATSTGAITMVTETENLYLKLTAAEMTQAIASTNGKMYYATTDATTPEMTHNYLEDQAAATFDLATFSLASGETKYDCTYKYTVKLASITGVDQDTIKNSADLADDIKVVFSGTGISGEKTMTIGELITAGETGVVLSGTAAKLTTGAPQTIKVYSSFENTTKVQDALAGINYNITITPDKDTAFKCSLAA